MPEFTDNLRTTKVLLTKFDRLVLFAFACMLARSSVVYDGARCSIARECIFPPEIVFLWTQFENISLLLLSSEFFLNFMMKSFSSLHKLH